MTTCGTCKLEIRPCPVRGTVCFCGFTDDEKDARAALSRFTPEEPAFLSPSLYDRLAQEPAMTDMMDRVRKIEMIPTDELVSLARHTGKPNMMAAVVKDMMRSEMLLGTTFRHGPYPTDPYAPGARRRRR